MDQLPPHNLEAEQAVLGSLLIDQDAILKIADVLDASDFYSDKHRLVFEAMLQVYGQREPIDVLNVTNRLKEKNVIEIIGGRSYLVTLTNTVPSAANVLSYANIVQRKATLRRLIQAAHEILQKAFDDSTDDISAQLDASEQALFAVSQKHLRQNFIPIGSILTEAFDRIDEIHKEAGKLRGVPTGFSHLDTKLGGLQKSDLVILAARPSIGKTSLALDIARHVAVNERVPVGIFSLEMSKDQLVDRLLCAQAGVDLWKMRTGRLSDAPGHDDFPRIGQAMGVLSEAPLYIDDSPMINVMEIRTKARRLQMEHGLGLIVLDYLQLMEGRSKNSDNRVQEIAEISRSLKGLARELQIPVLALSQLSRAVEAQNVPIPKLAHLRESGCLTGDTRILNADTGELIGLQRIAEEGLSFYTLTVNAQLHLERKRLKKAFYSGVKRVYQLTLASGKTIRASSNHPFLTIDGWSALDQLSVGKHIATPRLISHGLTLVPDAELSALANSDIFWDEIVSIIPLGEELVYDAEVEDNHNFLANDIIVHNSIEQDADVVMFIYREDYYKPETDKKHIADIIIAKHRNGPTGKIELYFDMEKASFKNLEKTLTE